jgi:hypothetical protein
MNCGQWSEDLLDQDLPCKQLETLDMEMRQYFPRLLCEPNMFELNLGQWSGVVGVKKLALVGLNSKCGRYA